MSRLNQSIRQIIDAYYKTTNARRLPGIIAIVQQEYFCNETDRRSLVPAYPYRV